MQKRCGWCGDDPLYCDYHDTEWGRPIYDDRLLFEFLILEGMQAGLSWITILKKRENYRQAFAGFDAEKIAKYTPKKIESLLQNPGIIRNRLKVNAIVNNAKSYLALTEQRSFSEYLWEFVDHQPIQNRWRSLAEIPTHTDHSDQMAKSLKKQGFKFVGTTICYAFMQAVGMVNDHLIDCDWHDQCLD